MPTTTRIAINAQLLPDHGAGGIVSVLVGLISSLGKLQDGYEEYVIIGPWQEPDWVTQYIGPNQRVVPGPSPPESAEHSSRPLEPLKQALGPLRPLFRSAWRELFPLSPVSQSTLWPQVPVSDGFYEDLGCDVVHFPWQSYTLCALPTVYNPHDLQHVHYPEFFSPTTIAWRESIYPAGCRLARAVVVGSEWTRQDLIRCYGIDPDKIQVIPWAPPTEAYPDPSPDMLRRVMTQYKLRQPFALYPAMTWEHKNHLRLLDALALLRSEEDLVVNLICTGHRDSRHWPRIAGRLTALDLEDQVQFLGMVPAVELQALYRLAQFVLIPTLFEAASAPIFEAWRESIPVACSAVTSLPEQAGDAALLFNPFSVEDISSAIRRMATDGRLRSDLNRKGQRRLRDFSWERTAKAYRAVYRRAARSTLTEEDHELLSWDWMRNPRPRGAS